uniref:Uncharacterized protein n=1 Tax=Pipistrellus kuhlii TaxID=59472 RepID=A0A7J7Y996_PIPKU|nr:hypothetical protein mPipKuh1_010351 [Pipistrellus kuhlii]
MLESASGSQNQKGIWFQTEPLASKGCLMEHILKPQLPIDETFKVALLPLYSLLCLCLVCSSPGCLLEAALGCRGHPKPFLSYKIQGETWVPSPFFLSPKLIAFYGEEHVAALVLDWLVEIVLGSIVSKHDSLNSSEDAFILV